MALKLKRTVNQLDHEYWVAEKHENLRDGKNKTTEIVMMLYTDETKRKAGQLPVLRERFAWNIIGNDKTTAAVYAHVKESRKEKVKEGEIEIEKEKNEFVTAEDI